MTLRTSIVAALTRAKGAKLSLRDIGAKLGMECGNTGEPWQNVCRLVDELSRLERAERIICTYADGQHLYWIEPPKDDER